ncbi:SDR family NAD(P)-dependent oxidoreductase [Streptomyces sp. CH-036]|uniref:SDR family NAD(P)-dependent oxidoreductase n=1 Tax=Streptomyces sp. CH-036 TaxID=3406733 RepID=UPI003C73FC68
MNENHTDRGRFSDRTAIVTGASRGIGLAVAERLVAEGGRVCLTAHKAGPLEEAAALPPGRVVTVAGRADDPEHRREVFDTVAREFGGLDVLVRRPGGDQPPLTPEAARYEALHRPHRGQAVLL